MLRASAGAAYVLVVQNDFVIISEYLLGTHGVPIEDC